jgi:lysozyme family protein
MNAAIENLITDVIRREAGYVNHRDDRGGPTKFGITQATLARWRKKPVTANDVENMQESEARDIYRAWYFKGFESVTDPKTLAFLFDYAVNAGNSKAVKAVQNAIGTAVDGVWGPKSQAALEAYGDQSKLYWPCVCYRFDDFMRIMGNDPSQTVFAHGWANRMKEFWS